MNLKSLLAQIALGEDSTRQFKKEVKNAQSLAAEMVAFANSSGGTILIGVGDDGTVPGLSGADVARTNQLISNAASQLVHSPLTVRTENVALEDGRLIIVLSVPQGLDKPYFDKNGVIWLRTGADKRRVNSREELRRLFQFSHAFHADELPTRAGIDKLDKLRFRDFLREFHKWAFPNSLDELARLLRNMNLATEDDRLNLAGLLLFVDRPEWIEPSFVVKAIRYPGNKIHPTDYLDAEDFSGPLTRVFEGALAFVMRNLHKVQASRGVNMPGLPEIPEAVFEELLVNALVHRDYLISAPIRLLIFDDRIEIQSPGHLPDNMTVEKIRTGNSNIRNPILASYAAKGLLPYHGLGSGIVRALEEWPAIEFVDDRDSCLFTATVLRKPVETAGPGGLPIPADVSEEIPGVAPVSGKRSRRVLKTSDKHQEEKTPGKPQARIGKSSKKILETCREKSSVTVPELASLLGITDRAVRGNIRNLRQRGLLRRVGGKMEGRWEVVE